MGNLMYIASLILGIGWLIGYFGYKVGGAVHLLLIAAVIALLLGFLRGNNTP